VADRSQEDKATLLYLLTSPYSNIIGVYQIVPRIAAAEMGWTADQLLTILKRLNDSNIALFDVESGFVWVKNWWDHNSAKMAVATTLRSKTLSQIDAVPASWRDEFLPDFLNRLPSKDKEGGRPCVNLQTLIANEIAARGHRVSIPYQQGSHSPPGNSNGNYISNSNTIEEHEAILEFPDLETSVLAELQLVIRELPSHIQQDAVDEIAAKMKAGILRSPVALARHFAANPAGFVVTQGYAVRAAREKRAQVQAELEAQAKRHADELALRDEDLLKLSEQQFLDVHRNLPEALRHRMWNRRTQLTLGAS
jgi:hypothetical protein